MKKPSELLLSFAEKNLNAFFCFNITTNHFVYTNTAFKTIFDQKEKPKSPKTLFLMVRQKDRKYLKNICANLKPSIFQDDVEFKLMPKSDKSARVYKMGLLKEELETGDQILTGYLEDITVFRENEDILNELTERKNAILNIMSHDLAGPLNSIKTFTHLLSKKLPSKQDELLNSMLSSIETLSENCIQMIQEFIQLEFIKSVNVDLIKERKDLVTTITNIRQQYLDAQKVLDITFEFDTNLAQVFVEIDENKFMQVINNLYSNAIKFTKDGGKISLSLEEKDETVLITLADTGIGIPKKYHATLFERFTTARRPGLKGEPSVGLGMSIIKTIIDWHNGKIWFNSEENVGTTFYIELKKSE